MYLEHTIEEPGRWTGPMSEKGLLWRKIDLGNLKCSQGGNPMRSKERNSVECRFGGGGLREIDTKWIYGTMKGDIDEMGGMKLSVTGVDIFEILVDNVDSRQLADSKNDREKVKEAEEEADKKKKKMMAKDVDAAAADIGGNEDVEMVEVCSSASTPLQRFASSTAIPIDSPLKLLDTLSLVDTAGIGTEIEPQIYF